MGLITKGGINIIDKEAYVHPLELEDLEFLIKIFQCLPKDSTE